MDHESFRVLKYLNLPTSTLPELLLYRKFQQISNPSAKR